MKPTEEQMRDALARCETEIQSLSIITDDGKWRNLVLCCNIDMLHWFLGETDEVILGIKSWEELGVRLVAREVEKP